MSSPLFLTRRPRERQAGLIALAAVLGLAAWLRFQQPALVPFTGDNASILNLADHFLRTGDPPQVSIKSSVGPFNAPLPVYLAAVPLAFTRDAAAATALFASAWVLAVAVTFFFVRRRFGLLAATMASVLLAANFWGIIFSRRLVGETLVPLLACLFFWLLVEAVLTKRAWKAALSIVFLSLALQAHLAALGLLPLFAVGVVALMLRTGWRPLLAGALTAMVLASPYIYYQARHGFSDFRHALSDQSSAHYDLQSFRYARYLGTVVNFGPQLGAWTGEPFPDPRLPAAPQDIFSLAAMVSVGILTADGLTSLRRRSYERAFSELMLAAWCVTPLLWFVRHPRPVYAHYFLTYIPAAATAVGVAASRLTGFIRRLSVPPWRTAATPVAGLLLLATGYLAVLQMASFRGYQDWINSDARVELTGITWQEQRRAFDELEGAQGRSGTALISAAEGYSHQAEFLARGRLDRWKTFEGSSCCVVPGGAGKAVYLLRERKDTTAESLLAGRLRATLVARLPLPGGDAYLVYALPSLTIELRDSGAVDYGGLLALLPQECSASVEGGERCSVRAAWRVLGRPGSEYHFFYHLVDGAWRSFGGWDGVDYPSRFWEQGDVIFAEHSISTPEEARPGVYRWLVGVYAWPQIAPLGPTDVTVGELRLPGDRTE